MFGHEPYSSSPHSAHDTTNQKPNDKQETAAPVLPAPQTEESR